MARKYELTDEVKLHGWYVLHRIKALRDFDDVKAGNLGGWIESEDNLSHKGDCWVYGNAMVFANAKLKDNAKIYNQAKLYNNALAYGCSRIARCAKVYNRSYVGDNARIDNFATVRNGAQIYDDVCVTDWAVVQGESHICGSADIYGRATVRGRAFIGGVARIYDNASIDGFVRLIGQESIGGNAKIRSDKDFIVFKNWWSSGRYFTWTRSNNMWRVGCFYGTGEKLIAKAYAHGKESGDNYRAIVEYVEKVVIPQAEQSSQSKKDSFTARIKKFFGL